MSGEEICIIVIPNDFPVNNDGDQNTDASEKKMTSQHIVNVEKKRTSIDDDEAQHPTVSMLVRAIAGETIPNHYSGNRRTSDASVASLEKHTKEYPCPECKRSLASRFRYHAIPKLKLRDTVWISTNNNKSFFIICYTELGPQSDGMVDELRRAEIGIRDGSKVFIIPISCAVGIRKVVEKQKTLPSMAPKIVRSEGVTDTTGTSVPVVTPLPSVSGASYEFLKSVRARMTVHKIIGLVQCQSSLTFDYIFFCVLASMIAGLGLLENNPVILVASMLVSPLMGPILGFVIGIRVRDKKLWLSGLKSECTGILIAILSGFFFGLCTTWSETKWGSSASFPTDEMRSRGDYRRLWSGALVALPSGAAAALSVLGGNFGSLVGVAISASLLPPAVNTGLLFSYSLLSVSQSSIGRHSTQLINENTTFNSLSILDNCTAFVDNDYLPLYACDMSKEAAQLAIFSFIITLINILCICFMVVIVLIIKKVMPITPDHEITKFWRSDMTKVRAVFDNKVQNELDDENAQEIIETIKAVGDANELSPQHKEHII